jgi:hypothetical protein
MPAGAGSSRVKASIAGPMINASIEGLVVFPLFIKTLIPFRVLNF